MVFNRMLSTPVAANADSGVAGRSHLRGRSDAVTAPGYLPVDHTGPNSVLILRVAFQSVEPDYTEQTVRDTFWGNVLNTNGFFQDSSGNTFQFSTEGAAVRPSRVATVNINTPTSTSVCEIDKVRPGQLTRTHECPRSVTVLVGLETCFKLSLQVASNLKSWNESMSLVPPTPNLEHHDDDDAADAGGVLLLHSAPLAVGCRRRRRSYCSRDQPQRVHLQVRVCQ